MTLKKKFILVGLIIFLSMVGIFSIGQYTVRKVESFDQVKLNLGLVEIGMLKLRRNEKDFLARKKLKYIDKFNHNFAQLDLQVANLYRVAKMANLNIKMVTQTATSIKRYRHLLEQVFALQKTIGLDPNDGLYGDLRDSVHRAEGKIIAVNDQFLRADMLQLRRNEKDFMLRLDLEYSHQFQTTIELFFQHLNNSQHDAATKQQLKHLMQQYQTSFMQLVNQQVLIGLDSNQGLLGEMRNSVHTAEEIIQKLAVNLQSNIEAEIGSVDTLVIIEDIISAFFTLIVIAMIFLLSVSVLRPLQQLSSIMQYVAENNDLTTRIPITNKDEIGDTGLAFNNMLEKFQIILGKVNGVTDKLTIATDDMGDISTNTNQGIKAQREQTTQLTHRIDEMAAAVEDIAKCALQATATASAANETSREGQHVINTSARNIKTLSNSFEDAAEAMRQVDEDSIQIGSVLEVIQSIAEQTNLLALNAAIEAARAGEQGRGFAVVADEVRTLAASTQTATKKIQLTIDSLQSRSNKAVNLMTDSRQKVQQNVSQTSAAGDAFAAIVVQVLAIDEINQQISSIAEKQGLVMTDINQNIISIGNITESSVDGANQTEQASSNLSELAMQLKASSSQFIS
ncbi:MAG: hypothetical protein OFPII_19670 [Osedax symbiont Rs1]|nr:MAG: hypothetical protein OFPII_19670 [Osedax symbiont Rs1]